MFSRSHVSSNDEVAFVFAIFVVHHQDHLPLTKIFEYFFNRVDGHWLPRGYSRIRIDYTGKPDLKEFVPIEARARIMWHSQQ
jgi:hypothetical protein